MDVQTKLEIGAPVRTPEGSHVGTISRIVAPPTLSHVTHVVVDGDATTGRRLVVVSDLVDKGGSLTLRDGASWPDGYELAETVELLEPDQQVLAGSAMPYALGDVWMTPYVDLPAGPRPVAREVLPPGEIAIEAGFRVVATDGPIGDVAALLLDPQTETVTHVLLRHGHLWGKRTVAVPIDLVESVDTSQGGTVMVGRTREELEAHTID